MSHYNDYNSYDNYNYDYDNNYHGRGRRGGRGGRGGYGGGRGGGRNNNRRGRGSRQGGYYQQNRNYGQYQQKSDSYGASGASGASGGAVEFPHNLTQLLENINKKSRDDIISIDGSKLEGGGQILRNAMTFAALLKQPIHITKIRGGRSKPGLAAQHLHGILLAQKIFGGYLSGAYLRSMEVLYIPEGNKVSHSSESNFFADTETAGSVCLLLQSSLPLLFMMPFACNIVLKGGTNASFAPQIDYFKLLVKPMLDSLFGLKMDINVKTRGFYPKGGGEVNVSTTPISASNASDASDASDVSKSDANEQKDQKNTETDSNASIALPAINMCTRGKLVRVRGVVILGGNNIDLSVGEQIREGALAQLRQNKEFSGLINNINNNNNNSNASAVDIAISREFSFSTGTAIVLVAETEFGCMLGGSALGKAGGRSSRGSRGARGGSRGGRGARGGEVDHAAVGREAAKELLTDWNFGTNACTDRHFQDQLIVFMALAAGRSKFKTCELELHTETAMHFAELLTGAKFEVKKEEDGVLVECEGIGLKALQLSE